MVSTNKGIVRKIIFSSVACAAILSLAISVSAQAEPLLLVYPSSSAVFRYDPNTYEVLGPADPNYDPAYDIGGKVLWDKVEQRIAIEVYRAPQLNGFEVSPLGLNEFVTMANQFRLIADGFFIAPRQLNKLYVRVVPDPPQTTVLVTVAGKTMEQFIMPIPGFVVTTSIGDGFYSDTQQYYVAWSGSVGMRITVYGDKNGNYVHDGGPPRWSVYVMDNSIPVQNKTWGGIKKLYGSN